VFRIWQGREIAMKPLSFAVALIAVVLAGAFAQDAKPAKLGLMRPSFSKLPIYFVENRGVYPDGVKYYIQGADKTLYFTKTGITFRLRGKTGAGS